VEDEKRSEDQAGSAYTVVPFQLFAEVGHGEYRKALRVITSWMVLSWAALNS
jgi:hypothetical protein